MGLSIPVSMKQHLAETLPHYFYSPNHNHCAFSVNAQFQCASKPQLTGDSEDLKVIKAYDDAMSKIELDTRRLMG
ncbi:MAG: hypothetical protein ACI8Y7_000631 [Candidatus Woesearchaeota archaeon]|jgi:hypothetical protein